MTYSRPYPDLGLCAAAMFTMNFRACLKCENWPNLSGCHYGATQQKCVCSERHIQKDKSLHRLTTIYMDKVARRGELAWTCDSYTSRTRGRTRHVYCAPRVSPQKTCLLGSHVGLTCVWCNWSGSCCRKVQPGMFNCRQMSWPVRPWPETSTQMWIKIAATVVRKTPDSNI